MTERLPRRAQPRDLVPASNAPGDEVPGAEATAAPASPRELPGLCSSPACWCRAWPPRRAVMSIGCEYSMEEVEPGLFRYVYLPMKESA